MQLKGKRVAEQRGSAQYEASYRAVLDLVDRFPADRRTEPGVCGEWSLKDLLGHLAFWDADHADGIEAIASGSQLPSADNRDWQTINVEQAALRSNWPWDQVIAELRANHDRLAPLLDDPGESDLDEDPIHEHWDEHRAQIEAWLGAQDLGLTADDDPVTAERARDAYLDLQQATMAIATAIPESMRYEPGVCGIWTLKDLMGHLAFWDGVVADGLTARKEGTRREPDRRTYDEINAEAAAMRSEWTWDEVLQEVTGNRERLIPILTDPGEADDYKIYMHWQEHGAQVEAWAGMHSHV